jgi:hypothetical protein
MTFTERATAIVNAIIDGTATPQQMRRIGEAFAARYPANFAPANPANPTSADYARCFVLSVRQFGRRTLRSVAVDQSTAEAQADAQAAADAAQGDL